MATLYYEKDGDLSLLKDKVIGVIGYGSQGHAHAQNLRDSGMNVIIGLYQGSKSWPTAEKDGFKVDTTANVARDADIIVMLLPDTSQAEVYRKEIARNLTPGKSLVFAHGFTIHFKTIVPPSNVDVWMIAPKAPGHRVREVFKEGQGVPSLVAVHQDATGRSKQLALAYAKGIGSLRAGVLDTTFKEETETDLFGEQTVLCGGITRLMRNAFEVLVEAGYQPESAYFEVVHEMKLIVDLIYQGGFEYMRYSVSDTAEYGDYTRGDQVIDAHVKDNMRKVLKAVQDGSFAKEWIAENEEGRPRFYRLRQEQAEHPLQKVGKELRDMMPWMKSSVR
ncbi:MAG: ketol-acid reductoisomerase [Chloroflexi bacterium]|nr:ketol-acid reductoisomerase [Chloroflexota bacterium]